MAGKLNKFQTVPFMKWKGMTKANHIGALFQDQPQRASDVMIQLMAWKHGKTIESFISEFPTKEFEDDSEYYWDVLSSSRRNIPLLEARDENGVVVVDDNSMVGAGTAPFYLVFQEDWFADGETLEGNLNEFYQMRVLGEPKVEGSNFVYKVELIGGNTKGIPAERLLAGEKFSRGAAFVERELSRGVGDVRFTSPIKMRNEWTNIRKKVKAPGSMLGKKLAVGIPFAKETKDGYSKGVATIWMHHVDYVFETEFSEEKNWAIAWGRSNRTAGGEYMNYGKSGSVIKTGAGIFEQMEVANTHYYNTFSIKFLEDALYDLSVSKLGMNERQFVIKTGERGMLSAS